MQPDGFAVRRVADLEWSARALVLDMLAAHLEDAAVRYHARRVAATAVSVALLGGQTPAVVAALDYAALLHDVAGGSTGPMLIQLLRSTPTFSHTAYIIDAVPEPLGSRWARGAWLGSTETRIVAACDRFDQLVHAAQPVSLAGALDQLRAEGSTGPHATACAEIVSLLAQLVSTAVAKADPDANAAASDMEERVQRHGRMPVRVLPFNPRHRLTGRTGRAWLG